MTVLAEVILWGTRIGAVAQPDDDPFGVFEYDPEFIASGIEVSPIKMPLQPGPYRFTNLPLETFHGLPGLLADSLPDKFGNALIDTWLARQGRTPDSFTAVERLCYIGKRGMGALEFEPAVESRNDRAAQVDVGKLVELASRILAQRQGTEGSLDLGAAEGTMRDILRVGTSAGGARAKAVVAWNPDTQEVRSGQLDAPPGFEHWLLKFDGVSANKDKELADPQGFGVIEYGYSIMAREAGIKMADCQLLEEGGRRHFMTRRFDRAENRKLHMQSLCGLAHYDFNNPTAHSYEEALTVIRQLGLAQTDVEEQFRRMVFNIVARNHDDHVKNIAFLMSRTGEWSLAPAFDVMYAYNPAGTWTSQHQMSVNGKRRDHTRQDLIACARAFSIPPRKANAIIEDVRAAVSRWPQLCRELDVEPELASMVNNTLRVREFGPARRAASP